MSVKYSTVPLISHPDLTAMDLLVWGALCSCAKWDWRINSEGKREPKRGTCFPGRKELAERALCNVRTVTRAIKNLEEMGFISYSRTQKGNGWGANHYTLNPIPANRSEKESIDLQSIGLSVTTDSQSRPVGTVSPDPRDCESRPVGTHSHINNTNITIPRTGEGEQCPVPADLPIVQEGKSPDSATDLQGPDTSEPVDRPPVEGQDIHATLGSDTDIEGTTQPQEERLSFDDVERLFDNVWKSYPNHGKEAVARRAFRKLIPPDTLWGEAQGQYQDLVDRLNEAVDTRWMDDGEINTKFVPYFGNFLEDNYELG